MDNLQNEQKSPIATYQLFLNRSLTKQINNQKVLPVFGQKINLQSPRLQNHNLNQSLSPKPNQTIKSHSVRNLPKKHSSYYYFIDESKKKINQKKFNFDNSSTNSKPFKIKSKPYKVNQKVVLPQLYTLIKFKQQSPSKNNITEPTIVEELQPWEYSRTSIPYF